MRLPETRIICVCTTVWGRCNNIQTYYVEQIRRLCFCRGVVEIIIKRDVGTLGFIRKICKSDFLLIVNVIQFKNIIHN